MKKIAVIGRTNAGKSTLINNLTSQAIGAVSKKVHTTRQIVVQSWKINGEICALLDTPGLCQPQTMIEKIMFHNIQKTIDMAAVIWWVIDGTDFVGEDLKILEKILQKKAEKTVLILNKKDKLKEKEILQKLHNWSEKMNFAALVPISALKKHNLKNLENAMIDLAKTKEKTVAKNLNSANWEKIFVKEAVREQIMLLTKDEIPYKTGIAWVKKKKLAEGKMIWLDIYVEKPNQKKIVIGKEGSKIHQIKLNAEKKIRKILKEKISLSFLIHVENKWFTKKAIVKKLELEMEVF